MKKKVVVFGDLPIATKVVSDLRERSNVSLEGVVIGNRNPLNADPWPDVPLLADYARLHSLREFRLAEFETFEPNRFDLALVCRYSRILRRSVLKCFAQGAVNFHGGLLPEMGGLYSACHAILLGHEKAGGTLHYIDDGIDTGAIVKRAEFAIGKHDTSFDVFQKTQLALFDAYLEMIDSILAGCAPKMKQCALIKNGVTRRYLDKTSLDGKKLIQLGDDPKTIDRIVRAFDFPGHEPAFAFVEGRKVFFSTRRFFENER